MKFYAVQNGRVPGVYTSWDACKEQVDRYPGAVYKSFGTEEEARRFVSGEAEVVKSGSAVDKSPKDITKQHPGRNFAYVDGSYNPDTKCYGYGGIFVTANGEAHPFMGSGNDPEMVSMRNVAGEVVGSRVAVEKAMQLGVKEMDLYYDYAGIEQWATGGWQANKVGTSDYRDFMQAVSDQVKINFVKVKGHSGVEGNEMADKLAKAAVGLGRKPAKEPETEVVDEAELLFH